MNKCKKIICFTLVILFLITGIPFNNYYENEGLFGHAVYAADSEPLSADEQAVADDKVWLIDNFIILNDYPFMNWLKTDLIFPLSGPNDSSFSWSSSDTTLIDAAGKVYRPIYSGPDSYDVLVTATIAKGTASDTKTFDASVVTLPGSLAVHLEYEDLENDTVPDMVSINGTAALGEKYMSNPHLFSVNSNMEGAGSVYTKKKIQLADDLSFSTHFLFDIYSMYSRYDEGFTFTLQADSPTLLGTSELSSMGSPPTSTSLSIEFDTKKDSETAEYEYHGLDTEHHIAVYVNGDYQHPIAIAPAAIYDNGGFTSQNFEANQRFKVWIQYDGTAKRIEIYQVYEGMDDPLFPVISASLDLTSVFKTSDNELIKDIYAGFTGNGADAFSTHAAIYEWSFKNDKFPIGYNLPKMTITGLYQDASNVSITTETIDIDSGYKSLVTALVKDSLGNVMQGVMVNFTSESGIFESTEGITTDGTSATGITDVNGILTATLTSTIPVIVQVRASAQGGAYAEADASLIETDEAKLNKDYDSLLGDNILGDNESLNFVRSNLTLPSTGENGSTISWSSSNTAYLTSAGIVVRPTAAQGDQTVILTAHLENGSSSKDKNFSVKVKINDVDMVNLDSDWLTDTMILNGNTSLNEVIANLYMPAVGLNGSNITWISNSPLLSENGIVIRPPYYEPIVEVMLFVTFSMGTESITRNFTIKILPNEPTDLELLNEAYNALDFEDIRNENLYENNIISNMILPSEGLHDIIITWDSSDLTVITTDGTVLRPTYTNGNKAVVLTATLKKSDQTLQKIFSLIVTALDPTDSEAVGETMIWLDDALILNGNTLLSEIIKNLDLPDIGLSGSVIRWESTDSAVADTDGTIVRPTYTKGDKDIKLTAYISRGSVTQSKNFNITVKANTATDTEAIDKAKTELTYRLILDVNSDKSNVIAPLNLPLSGPLGTVINWSSSHEDVVSTALGTLGRLDRPDYIEGDCEVTLTAVITRGLMTETMIFTVTVKALPVTDRDAVQLDSQRFKVTDTLGFNDTQFSVKQNLMFNLVTLNGSTIELASSDPDVLSIRYELDGNATGVITRPSYSQDHRTVMLTVTIRKGIDELIKTFEYTILAMKDETAPKMVLTSPADGSTNVHYNTKEVIVTFDEDIQLYGRYPAYAYKLDFSKIQYSGGMPGSNIIVKIDGNKLILVNTETYFPSGLNEIRVPSEVISDLTGNKVLDEINIAFSIEEKQIKKIEVISSVPASGESQVRTDTTISLQFNSTGLAAGTSFNNIVLYDDNFRDYPVNCTINSDVITITQKYADRTLSRGRTYFILIPPGAVEDRFMNQNALTLLSFVTLPDPIGPEISSTYPSSGDTNVSVSTGIRLYFKDTAVLAGGRIRLTDADGSTVEFTTEAFIENSKTVYIDPVNPLKPNTRYTVTVQKDYVKTRLYPVYEMKTDYVFSFTTGTNSLAVISTNPVDNAKAAPVDSKVEIFFSTDIKPGSNFNEIKIVDSLGNKLINSVIITGNIAYVKVLNSWFNPEETYTVSIPTGAITDLSGKANDSLQFSFTTGKLVALSDSESFAVGPSVRWLVNRELVFSADKLFYIFRDKGRSIVSYDWNFADAATSSGKIATHTYISSGEYAVTLTLKDSAGLSYEITKTVYISSINSEEDIKLRVSPNQNQNLTHSDEYNDPLDVIPGRRLYAIDVLYEGIYVPNELVNVSLYKNNIQVKNYGDYVTSTDASGSIARAYFPFDYRALSLFGTYELVFTWGNMDGDEPTGKQVRRTVIISDKRTVQDLRFRLYNMDNGEYFTLYPYISVELDGQKTVAMKTVLSDDDGGGICYSIKDVGLGVHEIKIIREGSMEHFGEAQVHHTGMHDISILKAERDKLGITRIYSKYSSSNNTTDTTFIYTIMTDSSMETKFYIDANWVDTDIGFYEIKYNNYVQRIYSGESWFDLDPTMLYPGERLLVRAVSRYGNASAWVDAKISTIDPAPVKGIVIEYSYVDGKLVAESFGSMGSHSEGEIEQISQMPFLEHDTIVGLPASGFDVFNATFRQTPENLELIFNLDAEGSYGEKKKKKKMVTVGWGVDTEIEGSFKLVYNKLTENWTYSTGEVTMTGDLYVYKSKGYVVPVIDTGAEITLTAGAIIGNTIYIDKRPEAKYDYSGIIRVEPYVTVDVYGGIKGFNIEGLVDGRIKTQLHIPTGYIQVDPSVTGWIKATVFGIRKTVFDATADTTWNNGGEIITGLRYSKSMLTAINTDDGVELVPRNYLMEGSYWAPVELERIDTTSKKVMVSKALTVGLVALDSITERTIQLMKTNIYPYSDVNLVENGNDLWMIWTDDNPERSDINRSQMHYSVLSEGTWSAPSMLNNDGTADFRPVAAEAGDGILIAWQNFKRVLTDDDISFENIVKHSEISVSNGIYSKTGEFNTITLSDDELYDHSPCIAALNENNGLLVWTKSKGLGLATDDAGSDQLVYSVWNGSTWSVAETVQSNLSNIINSSLYAGNGQYLLLYSLDEDGDLSTANDWEIYARIFDIATNSWGEAVRITNNEVSDSYAKAVFCENDWFITWNQNEQFVYQYGLSGKTETSDALSQVSSNYSLTARKGEEPLVALVFPKTDEDLNRRLATVFFDVENNVWGNEVYLTDDDLGYVKSISPTFTSDKKLNTAFTTAEIITEVRDNEEYNTPGDKVDLNLVTYTPKRDLEISETDGIELSTKIPFPGTAVKIYSTISNKGDFAEHATLIIYDGAPESKVKIGEITTKNPIPAHSDVTLEVEWVLEDTTRTSYNLHAVVIPDEGITETDSNNNSSSLEVYLSDISVEEINWNGMTGNDYLVSPLLSNTGTTTLKDVEVIIEHQGVKIASSIIETLSPGDFADLDFLISSVGLTEDINGHYQLKVKAVTPAGISEYSLENNMQDFEIYPVSISVASMNISNGEKDVKIDEVITLTFSRPIIEGINYSKITFTDNSLNKVEFSKSIEGSTLTLTPLQPLVNGTIYKLSLPVGAVEDSFGYVLKNTYEMSFETVISSPQVIFTDPWDKEHDVFLDSDIRIKYSESINAGPAYSDIYLALISNNQELKVATTKTLNDEWLTITPSGAMLKDAQYKVVVPKGSVKDVNNDLQASDYNFSFTTGLTMKNNDEADNEPKDQDEVDNDENVLVNKYISLQSIRDLQKDEEGLVQLDMSNSSETNDGVRVSLSTDSLKHFMQNDSGIQITTGRGDLTLSAELLKTLSDNGNLVLTITITKRNEALNPLEHIAGIEDEESIGEDETKRLSDIFDFSIMAGMKQITEFEPSITATFPYYIQNTEKPKGLIVCRYDTESGKWIPKGGKADPETGKITFSTEHFSSFAVFETIINFEDVTSSWAKLPVEIMASRRLINGRNSQVFDPLGKVTRAEFTAMSVRSLYIKPVAFTGLFKDVDEISWYAESVETAASLSLINGIGNGLFAPEKNISRQQLAVIAYRLYMNKNNGMDSSQDELLNYSFIDENEIDDYAKQAVKFLSSKGIMVGDGERFNPRAAATRQEAAVVLYRLLECLGEF